MADRPSIYEQLRSHAGARSMVRLSRNRASNENLAGFVLEVSSELVLLHTFHDFFPEGYSVARIRDVTDVRSGDYERHFERMLEGEGLLGGLDKKLDVDLTSMLAAVQSIHRNSGMFSVQCEDEFEPDQDYYVGLLVSSTDSSITLDNFDALGVWDEAPATIDLDDITMVEFRTPYVERSSRYLDGPPPSARQPT